MIYQNKPFSRRPWDALDHELVRHYEDIRVEGVSESKAFYFCLHTSQTFLNENGRKCDCPDGWWWPRFILDNFSVGPGSNLIGVYINDGIVGDRKFSVTIKNGRFDALSGKSIAICLEHINFETLTLGSLLGEDLTVAIRDCTIKTLIISDCEHLNVDSASNTTVEAVELYDSPRVNPGMFGPNTKVQRFNQSVNGVVGSLAVNLRVGGRLYRGEVPHVRFSDK